jgi:prolyl-tRNA synthetase
MRLSRYFLPTLKEAPSDAQIVSHQLMLRAGMIKQEAAGIYAWLPLGLRVLNRIEQIVREEQERAGAVELLMPTLQLADLWRESGRYDAYGPEMLRITDRDERRPRFGVMRGREFLMKDAYSFDIDEVSARKAYNRMFTAYLNTFARLGLKAVPMRADTGPIGGDLSHEFIVLADTGESQVFCDKRLVEMAPPGNDVDWNDLQHVFDERTALYAATEEMHDAAAFEAGTPEENRLTARGIEVGHIFYFGTKYSAPMKAKVAGPDGKDTEVHMGSYGVGVSRLLGAIIEASHDDGGIIWPDAVAPFDVVVINLRVSDEGVNAACEEAVAKLEASGKDVLYDDTDERPGGKFATADLIGVPWQLTIGPKGLADGVVELKRRATGEKQTLPLAQALEIIG